jgi:multidrug efflux system membrane fusion protein
VKPGERIVVDGQEKLRNGSRVIRDTGDEPNGPRDESQPRRYRR